MWVRSYFSGGHDHARKDAAILSAAGVDASVKVCGRSFGLWVADMPQTPEARELLLRTIDLTRRLEALPR